MPKYEVQRETINSTTGEVWKVGQTIEFTPPTRAKRDVEGRPMFNDAGEPLTEPTRVNSNLKLVKEPEPPAKK